MTDWASECENRGKWFGGCDFTAIFEKSGPPPDAVIELAKVSPEMDSSEFDACLEALGSGETYVHSICHCGRTVKRS